MGVLPRSVLLGTLFLVYAARSDALSCNPFGSPATINLVLLISKMVWFDYSMTALVSVFSGTVSFNMVPR